MRELPHRRLGPLALIVVLLVSTGCTQWRVVLEPVTDPATIEETIVLEDPGASGGAKIAQIDVSGIIIDAERPGLLVRGENPLSRFTQALKTAEEDRRVVAVLVRINSPGGGVTPSTVMYQELLDFRTRSGKPVVVSMGDVAASGGYYVACAADEIIAQPTTITGSIGVIMQTVNLTEGMRKIGIAAEAITSGPNKSMGSPFAPMPAEHRALLQGIVTEFYGSFRGVVTASRPNIPATVLDEVTDGRVVTGRRAAEVGLVDGLGGIREAFAAAKHRAGVTSARLVKYHRRSEAVASAYAHAPDAEREVNLLRISIDPSSTGDLPTFLYLWDPNVWYAR
ncbi:MAG: signal peptide peptidase SppA [Phycisphaerales bacterium]|nr:signal peptide peptidase SppA [Phycisphaerales bacterium]